MGKIRYLVLTPVKDEEKYIKMTLESMVKQTIVPIEWIIVNDGSTDNTGYIIDEYAERYCWIKAIHREVKGPRNPGYGVMEAFYEAYNQLKTKDWDYIVKLDGDLSFDNNYFEKCFNRFSQNPKLGICGGMVFHYIDGKLKLEKQPIFHVRGATKIYKRECWDSIGGLLKTPGWDTLDEVKASMLGYETRSFEELQVVHHRHTGTAVSKLENSLKDAKADYIVGYHPIFMMLKVLRRMTKKPYVIGALRLLYGYVICYLKKIPKIDDKELIVYLRQQQIRKILLKSTIWK